MYTRRIVASILLTITVMLAVEANASATVRFWIVDITILNDDPPTDDFLPDARAYGAMGINNLGEVVYAWSYEGELRPWVWLPASNYGLSAGFNDIYTLASTHGIARDINDSGIVVGQTGSGFDISYSGDDEAIYWTLAGGDAAPSVSGVDGSGAHAINNDSPPVIVGYYHDEGNCWSECLSINASRTVSYGFSAEMDDPWPSLSNLEQIEMGASTAMGVSSTSETTDLLAAGASTCHAISCFTDADYQCDNFLVATRWTNGTEAAMDVFSTFDVAGSYARGMSDTGHVVGWSVNGAEDPSCKRRAPYWPLPSSSPFVDLNDFMPVDQEEDAAWAEGVNNLAYPMVVGWNDSFDFGILWEQVAANDWVGTDLNDAIACSDRWLIRFAHDVNDEGWIAAIAADKNAGNAFHAVVLVPLPECPADVTQNGCVDVDDQLAVINGWGDCDPGVICRADINANCTVDTDDLLEVVSYHWCGSSTAAPCCHNCGESFGPGPDLQDLINAVLNSSIPYEDQDDVIAILIEHFG